MGISLWAATIGTGCAPGQRVTVPERVAVEEPLHVKVAEQIAADPLGFVREVERRSAALDSYCLRFYRQERLGLLPRLGATEDIRAKFRREPFSVKFDWVEPGDFYEAVYVEGRHDDKLLIRERRGFLHFPPQVRAVGVEDPVIWGRSLNPITDFGLAQVARRTLAPFDNPETADLMTIRYEGLVILEPTHRPAHHLRIEGAGRTDTPFVAQDFYIDAETLLPAGTDLWLPREQLGARYRYADVEIGVELTNEDFRLSRKQPAS
jgi:hypothetical protein